jgi:hypothetical protein
MANMIQKINLFYFCLKKIQHFGGPKHCPIPALPGLDRSKNSSSTYCLVCLSFFAKSELDKFKSNEEKAIIIFCNFLGFHFFEKHHIFNMNNLFD